jgi:hypothetical protein
VWKKKKARTVGRWLDTPPLRHAAHERRLNAFDAGAKQRRTAMT